MPSGSQPLISNRSSGVSFRRQAVDFHFSVVVLVIGCVAPAIETDIARLHTLGVDELTLSSLEVLAIFADALSGGVILIVVEDGAHALDEIGIVSHAHHDITI